MSEFQWFSGLGVKAAKDAVAGVRLDSYEDWLMLPEDCEAFDKFEIPKHPQYVLVSSLDGMALLRGPRTEWPNHAILDRGNQVGLWEFDTATECIVWQATVKPDKALRDAVAKTEAYIREDLGDARAFSLDSPKSRVPRFASLRAAGM